MGSRPFGWLEQPGAGIKPAF